MGKPLGGFVELLVRQGLLSKIGNSGPFGKAGGALLDDLAQSERRRCVIRHEDL